MANFTESQAKACTIINLMKVTVGDTISWDARVKDGDGKHYQLSDVSSKSSPSDSDIKSGVLNRLLETPIREVKAKPEIEIIESGKGLNETVG